MQRVLQTLNHNIVMMTCLVCLTLVPVFLYLNHAPLWHTDVWAHVRYGQWMREKMTIPQVEPLHPWTTQDHYIASAWLSQLILSYVYDLGTLIPYRWSWYDTAQPGGVDLLRVLHASLETLKLLFLFLAFQRITQSMLVSYAGMLLALVLSLSFIEVLRPQVFGELCLAVMLFLACRQPPSRLACWGVPLLMACWSNLHGSYLNGLLILLGILFGRFLLGFRQAARGETAEPLYRPTLRRTFRMFYWSILAVGFFNPLLSFQWYADAFVFARNANVRQMDEWQRLDWNSLAGRLFLGSLVLVCLTHALAKSRRLAGIGIGHGMLLLCFGLQVVFMQRMMPWWAIVCPLVCVGPWARMLGTTFSFRSDTKQLVMATVVVLTSLWVTFNWSSLGRILGEAEVPRSEQMLHPATPCMMDRATHRSLNSDVPPQLFQAVHRPRASIFASESLGDYLFFAQRTPVVIFTHVHLFSLEHWRRCMVVKEGIATWQKYLDEWNAQAICVEAELHPHLCEQVKRSPLWEVVLDETGSTRKPNPKSRLFIAIRKEHP